MSTPAERDDAGLVCTVTTVMDTLANVITFTDRNLAAGVDRMFLFLDDADADIHAHFADHPHVTTVRCDSRYWLDERPANLNVRQIHNANLVNTLLTPFPSVSWLFHIDGDECLDLDREDLLALGGDVRAVHLPPWEAVSKPRWEGPVDRFKRPLEHTELSLLTVLGVLDVGTMRDYFNGHVLGKRGSRPDLDVRVGLHTTRDLAGEEIPALTKHSFHVLHYESYSGEEFARKWAAHLSSTVPSRFSAKRNRLRSAIQAILENATLDDERKQELLMEVHRRMVQDDVSKLEELGYLVSPLPERHEYSPRRFPGDESTQVETVLSLLEVAETRRFNRPGALLDPRVLLWEVRQRLESGDADLVEKLETTLTRSRPRPN